MGIRRQALASVRPGSAARTGTQWYSQDVFAEIAHVHRTYVGSVERGERNLTLKNIAAFSQALGLPASKLLAKAEALIDKR